MKQPFDNGGTAEVQANLLSLPLLERQTQIQMIRNNFSAWMQDVFFLSEEQIDQLEALPAELRDQIAEGIASSWEAGILVGFHKEELIETAKRRGAKEIIYSKNSTAAYRPQSETSSESSLVSIWIRYVAE